MTVRHCWRLVLLVGLCAAWPAATGNAAPSEAQIDRDARELGERLVAPCCWRETLGSHSSPLATELRTEIRTRLARGETASAIEGDLVRRYGAKVRALPPDWDPRLVFGGIGFGVAGAALVALLIWVRRSRAPAQGPPERGGDTDDYDDELDDELAALDV